MTIHRLYRVMTLSILLSLFASPALQAQDTTMHADRARIDRARIDVLKIPVPALAPDGLRVRV